MCSIVHWQGGKLYVHITNEGYNPDKKWGQTDLDHELYTWNEQLLGNLVTAAGFKVCTMVALQHFLLVADYGIGYDRPVLQVENIESIIGGYPPNYVELEKTLSREEFNKAVREYGEKVHMMHVNVLAVKIA